MNVEGETRCVDVGRAVGSPGAGLGPVLGARPASVLEGAKLHWHESINVEAATVAQSSKPRVV